MIQINSTIHTKGGLTINTGSILDVTPHHIKPVKVYDESDEYEKTVYPMTFDVEIYKDLDTYKTKGSTVVVSEPIKEFNIGHSEPDVDIKSLTSVDGLLQILVNHIENGDENFSGVGIGKTEIVYP